jgi:ComF family protein
MYAGREGVDHLCRQCLETPRAFGIARALGLHRGTLLTLVHALKYRGKLQLAKPLGRLLFGTFGRFWEPDAIDAVLPVPLHARRLRQRGFNQALLLVMEWPRLGGGGFTVDLAQRWLVRRRATKPQIGLDRDQRRVNLEGAFAVGDAFPLRGMRVLLVDDVLTSGATVEACARLLTARGVARVDVLTLARAG